MSMNSVRCFLCLDMASVVKSSIGDMIASFKGRYPSLKWVSESSLHVTIKFLGEITKGKLNEIQKALKNASSMFPQPFSLTVNGAGVFRNWRDIRVVWVGLEGDIDSACALYASTDKIAKMCGFSGNDKEFSPHVTIARVRAFGDAPRSLADELKDLSERQFGTFSVEEFILMRSVLTPDGPIYSPIEIFKLDRR